MAEQLTQEQQMSPPGRPEPDNFGVAENDLTIFQRQQIRNFRPQMPPPLTGDEAIAAELEAKIAARKVDKEIESFKTPEERQLHHLRRKQRDADAAAAERAARKEWADKVAPQVERLKKVRALMTETPGYKASEVVRVDQAIRQLETYGSDLKHGGKEFEAIESLVEERTAQQQAALNRELQHTQAKMEDLQRRLAKKPVEDGVPVADKLLQIRQAKGARVKRLRDAGNDKDADIAEERYAEFRRKLGELGVTDAAFELVDKEFKSI